MVVRQAASVATAPLAGNLAHSLQEQTDLELVHDGAAAFLLLFDGLIKSAPDSPDLLLAAANAQSAYATAFLDRDESERARAMYAKARDYGLTVLRRNRRFARVWNRPLDEFETAIPTFRKRDVPALFTTAAAWAGWIVSSPDSMAAVAELSKAKALMQRVLELDPGYQYGGAESFFGIYCAVQPKGGGRDLEKSRAHFERAMQYAGPDYLLHPVALAEFYARYAFDRELFERTLRGVAEHTADKPEFRLMNAVARQRARRLLERIDDLF
jgi:tetratricopeptide (TPR) repeat protein